MAKASKGVASPSLDIGWAELRAGGWDAARVSFEKGIAEEETPEALEGGKQSVWPRCRCRISVEISLSIWRRFSG